MIGFRTRSFYEKGKNKHMIGCDVGYSINRDLSGFSIAMSYGLPFNMSGKSQPKKNDAKNKMQQKKLPVFIQNMQNKTNSESKRTNYGQTNR